MKRPTEGEIERATAALVPFAQEWRLPLNPEDLQAMAVAVLIHAGSDETLDAIEVAERRWIREHRAADREELSDDDLTIVEARAAAATAGPWTSFAEGRDHTGGDDFIRTGGLDDACPDLYVLHTAPDRAGLVPAPLEDQDFIAHARQDVPRLVAEVRRLRDLLARRPDNLPGS